MKILILGASSGFGEAFARQLAAQQHQLILCSEDNAGLMAVSQSIQLEHGLLVEIYHGDLTAATVVEELFTRYSDVDLVINSAGIGQIGDYSEIPIETELHTIQLNVLTLYGISKRFAQIMAARKSGGIINVASTAAYIPMPNFGVYAATKAFALSYTLALSKEVEQDGVRIMALCPGPTETKFLPKSHYDQIRKQCLNLPVLMSSQEVVHQALKKFDLGCRVYMPGRLNRWINVVDRFIPMEWILTSVYKLYGYIKRTEI